MMAGMRDEKWLGYDDDYVSTEDSRMMYIITWGSMYWSDQAMLSLSSSKIVIRPFPGLPPELKYINELVIRTIENAKK
jgi:hypothetical protein